MNGRFFYYVCHIIIIGYLITIMLTQNLCDRH